MWFPLAPLWSSTKWSVVYTHTHINSQSGVLVLQQARGRYPSLQVSSQRKWLILGWPGSHDEFHIVLSFGFKRCKRNNIIWRGKQPIITVRASPWSKQMTSNHLLVSQCFTLDVKREELKGDLYEVLWCQLVHHVLDVGFGLCLPIASMIL